MARTFRVRRHAPKHTKVTDGRSVIVHGEFLGRVSMDFLRRDYIVEKKADRKAHYALYRARVKHAIRHERWEQIPRFRRTSGWLTW